MVGDGAGLSPASLHQKRCFVKYRFRKGVSLISSNYMFRLILKSGLIYLTLTLFFLDCSEIRFQRFIIVFFLYSTMNSVPAFFIASRQEIRLITRHMLEYTNDIFPTCVGHFWVPFSGNQFCKGFRFQNGGLVLRCSMIHPICKKYICDKDTNACSFHTLKVDIRQYTRFACTNRA